MVDIDERKSGGFEVARHSSVESREDDRKAIDTAIMGVFEEGYFADNEAAVNSTEGKEFGKYLNEIGWTPIGSWISNVSNTELDGD